ncbi:MAG: cytochrome b/b6 domain-containing protein, partial [Salinigranum sp.]
KNVFGVAWITVHEVAAITLIAYVLFHLGHVASKGTWSVMWFGRDDVADLWTRFQNLVGLTDEYPKQFKYPSAQQALHLFVSLAVLGLVATGLVLLRRVQTPLWAATREFTFLGVTFGLGGGTVGTMGLVPWSFVLHDFLAIATLSLVMGHVYFALRPREWSITQSMVTGKIPVDVYAEKYSRSSWSVTGEVSADGGTESGIDADDER